MPETKKSAAAEIEQLKQLLLAANNRFAQGEATQLQELCSQSFDLCDYE